MKIEVLESGGVLEQTPFADFLPQLQAETPGSLVASVSEEDLGNRQNAAAGTVLLRRETSNRAGKSVIVAEFRPAISQEQLREICRLVKKSCGCGGHVLENGGIEFQGSDAELFRKFFQKAGWSVRGV
ncbi:MAG: hypothetical protein N2035_10070 [Chthoniobacterales bacterium]|nr:hypothetical protein [Chthoniobacterales bacterium]